MKLYTALLSTEQITEGEETYRCVKKISEEIISSSLQWLEYDVQRCERPLVRNCEAYLSLVLPGSQAEKDDVWIPINETLDIDQICKNGDRREYSSHEELEDQLHRLADTLPSSGVLLNVIWLVQGELPALMEQPGLFGSLKRLTEWYHAQVTFVTVGGQNCRDLKQWPSVLNGCVYNNEDDTQALLTPALCWRGNIQIHDAQAPSSVTLPGFSLQSEQGQRSRVKVTVNGKTLENEPLDKSEMPLLLGSSLELLQILNLDDFPAFLISSNRFTLQLCCFEGQRQRSHHLLHKLRQNRNTCYLVRLQHANEVNITDSKSDAGAWTDLVLQDVNNISSVPEVAMKGKKAFHYFLLFNEGQVDTECSAYLLHDHSSINGSMYRTLSIASTHHMARDATAPHSGDTVNQLLSQLPMFSAEALQRMQQYIENLQLLMLQSYSESLPSGEVPSFQALQTILSAIQLSQQDLSVLPKTALPKTTLRIPQRGLPSEMDVPSSEWIVRTMFRHQEYLRQHGKKPEGPAGLEPPKEQASSIDPWNFLRYFLPDGNKDISAHVQFSPIKMKTKNRSGMKLRKFDSEEAKDASWPDSRFHAYHDIYYNHGIKSEISESECIKLQSRLINQETVSIFTSKATVPGTMTTSKKQTTKSLKQNAKLEQRPTKISNTEARKRTESQPIRKSETRVRSHHQRKSTSDRQEAPTSPRQADLKKPATKQSNQASEKELRSQRHKRKLERIVRETLHDNGISASDPLLDGCVRRLYTLAKCFVKDLKSSFNLTDEMKKIANSHVKQVIEFEKANVKSCK